MSPPPATPGLPGLLPDHWDVHTDLAVLLGAGFRDTALALLERGQQRVVLHLGAGESAPALPAPAAVTRSRPELFQAILQYPEPMPRNVVMRRAQDASIGEAEMRELGAELADCLRSKELLHHTIAEQSGPNALRVLENSRDLALLPSVASLEGAFHRTPAVLVSPGPSLSKNVQLLGELKGHALLITGTHSLSVFDRIGLAPDFVLAADSGDLDRHWGDFDESAIEALFLSAACRRDQFERRAPRRFTFAGNPECESWIFEPLGEDAGISTGGSVSCSALSLALRLGCDPIVFVGQDLSFSGGRYYAEECLDGAAEVVEEQGSFLLRKPAHDDSLAGMTRLEDGRQVFAGARERIQVPGYHGGQVASSRSFLAFKFWFENLIESLGGRPRVWNCTEGGARIRGTRQLPLAEALPRLTASPLAPGEVLDAATAGFAARARLQTMRACFEALSEQMDTCHGLARRCRESVGEALRGGAGLERFESLEARLKRTLAPLTLLSVVAQREIATAVDQARRATDLAGNIEAAALLFGVIERGASSLREPLHRATERLQG